MAGLAQFQHAFVLLSEKIRNFFIKEIVVGLSDNLVSRSSDKLGKGGIATKVHTIDILKKYDVGNGIEQGSDQSFLSLDLFFCHFALGDIPCYTDEHLAAVPETPGNFCLDFDTCAILC